MSTIPASELVAVNPSVLAAGGSAFEVLGLILTNNSRVPIGTVQAFPDSTSVSDYFGASDPLVALSEVYFAGFDNSARKPGSLKIAQYNTVAVSAYLQGGDVSGLTLSQLQAISGSLAVVVDGISRSAASINLSSAVSFSAAAGIIQTGLNASNPSAASITASIGGVVTASAGATFTGSGSGTNLTTSAVTGVIHIGATIAGTGVPVGTTIVSQTSGTTGAAGVYVTSGATTSSGASLTASSNVLDVTAVASGSLQATDAISGSGVAGSTTVLAQAAGTAGGVGTYIISSVQNIPSTTVTSLSNILKVTVVGSGALATGNPISGTNVTTNSVITGQLTGSAGAAGLYTLSHSSTTVSETMTVSASALVVTYDSVSGGFKVASGVTGAASTVAFATGTISANLDLTSATGAVLSQGADAAVPAAFMDALAATSTSFVSWTTDFDPDGGSGNTVKLAFAAWNTLQNQRYMYVPWDLDVTPSAAVPATGSMGYILANNGNSGTFLIWDATDAVTSGPTFAAFVLGIGASIDFTETNGRTAYAYRQQSGLTGNVSTGVIAENLGGDPQTSGRGNGYNFYGAYGQADETFVWLQRGFVTGAYLWADSYINQIWLNNTFKSALLNFLGSVKSVPYGPAGNALISSALADPIQAGLNFGAFGPGVMSASQIAQVNAQAGADISQTLQTQGWYLQIQTPPAATRAARTSPPAKFWYIDSGSVQAITLNSITVQ